MGKNEKLSAKFRSFFQLPTSPVAINISNGEKRGSRPKEPSLFCEFVRKEAHDGLGYLITESDLQNFSARIILGFTEPKYVDLYPRVKPAKTKSVAVAPLEKVDFEPDVIVIITDPARMMKIVQVLYRATQKRLEANMTCEASAIAGEATALPYMEKRPNLTLLCGGARDIAGYSENELALGMPFENFTKLVNSLKEPTLATALCGCIVDEIPKHLKQAFLDFGFEKGTDHFYGEFERRVFRIYLGKDEKGLISIVTIHYPLKFKSQQDAQKAIDAAESLLAGLAGGGTVIQRENWLDLVLTVKFSGGLEKVALEKKKFGKTISGILTDFAAVINKIAR